VFPIRFEPNFYIDFLLQCSNAISYVIILLSEAEAVEFWGPSKKRGCFGYGRALGRKGQSHVGCHMFKKHMARLCSGD